VDKIKKAGIITGAVVGGVIGGTVSVIGKVTHKKFIDELGESIIDSTIMTGEVAGNVASGAANIISGAVGKDAEKFEEGKKTLKSTGGIIVGNLVTNAKAVVSHSGEIIKGAKEKDSKKVVMATKSLIKFAAVGAITVGVMKIKEESPEDENLNKK